MRRTTTPQRQNEVKAGGGKIARPSVPILRLQVRVIFHENASAIAMSTRGRNKIKKSIGPYVEGKNTHTIVD